MSSSETLQLRFDGPELQAHEMDVTLLAPSLMAFGELCTQANRVLNGEQAKVKVLLKADVKANCVTIELAVNQTLWESARALVQGDTVATAKTILEWIGILTTPATILGVSLWRFLIWKKNRKVTSAEIQNTSEGNAVVIRVEGDNNTITVPQPVFQLSKDVKVVENLKIVTTPVDTKNGINKATFIYQKKPQLQIDESTAREIRELHSDEGEPQTFTAHIVIYGPILTDKAKKWKFRLTNKVEPIDISETHIAEDVLKRGEIRVGDTYKVKLQMTERKTKTGAFVADYKVKEVLEFIPGTGAQQQRLEIHGESNKVE